MACRPPGSLDVKMPDEDVAVVPTVDHLSLMVSLVSQTRVELIISIVSWP